VYCIVSNAIYMHVFGWELIVCVVCVRVKVHELNLQLVPSYKVLFNTFLLSTSNDGKEDDLLDHFATWDPRRKLTASEENMRLGPPLVCDSFLICHFNGIEFRGDDLRKRRYNSGCSMSVSGQVYFGTIRFFLFVDGYNLAMVDWHETRPVDRLTCLQTVYLDLRSPQAKEFDTTHRLVQVLHLQPRNVIFKDAPRHWGVKNMPLTSTRVVIYNAHQLHRSADS
jgi:hypothetical protein